MSKTRRKPGCLDHSVEGYRVRLLELACTPGSVCGMLQVLGQLGRWMDAEGVGLGELDMAAVEAFRAARRPVGIDGLGVVASCASWCGICRFRQPVSAGHAP